MSETDHEKVTCMICGKQFSTLGTHINRAHNLSAMEYRSRFPDAILISGEHKEWLSNLVKKRFLQDPTLRQKVSSRTFDFINNKKLSLLLQRDYKSARICLKNSLWKPSIILYGSIIEAILTEKHPHSKDFYGALKLAYKNKDISEREYYRIQIIRDLRNFVHLHKELSEGEEINKYWAKTFAEICESIIRRFNK